MSQLVLQYENLCVTYASGAQALRGVSLALQAGECLALVGESGCGKTTLARAALGLLPSTAAISGSVRVGGVEVVGATPPALRALRGHVVGFVAQDPFEACSPLDRVERHVAEAWRAHQQQPPSGMVGRALDALGIRDAQAMMRRYPHQWSGGMLQRATIAAAAAHQPPLIVADEPTSALDADRADATLAALRATGAALLLVSHDIGVVARHADIVAVCYAGRIVEIGAAASVLSRPQYPYTIALLQATPRAGGGLPIPLAGTPPRLSEPIEGCSFAPRCAYAQPECAVFDPALHDGVACPVLVPPDRQRPSSSPNIQLPEHLPLVAAPRPQPQTADVIVAAQNVSKIYGQGLREVRAVISASLEVRRGEIVGIAGSSGCGKSTLLRLLATIEPPSSGSVLLGGEIATQGGSSRVQPGLARSGFVMPIFQDPLGSLDRRWPIWRSVTEPLTAAHRAVRLSRAQRRELAREQLAQVGLAHIDLEARPDELSIGQCQRVAIARALTAEPGLIIADEPTSALDASISAAVVRLLAAVAQSGTAMVIVSHDRPQLDALCHRVLTMQDGVLEER